MSTIKTNAILDASGGNTTTINGATPTAYNTVGKNRIINGNFDVWQRGSSFTITASTNTYSADRWRFVGSAFTGTLTRQSFTVGQTDVPSNPDYFARWDVTTNPAGNIAFSQYIENVQTLAGKTATVSFYLKSNSTIAANTLNLRYRQVTGGTGGATGLENIGEITTSWQKFTFTINIPSLSGATLGASNSSYLAFEILSPTAHTSAFQLDIAQVQVEEGSVATEFERRPYGTEFALCQRYCQVYTAESIGLILNAYHPTNSVWLKTTMRSTPTLTNGSFPSGGGTAAISGTGASSNVIPIYNSAGSWGALGSAVLSFTGTLSAEL